MVSKCVTYAKDRPAPTEPLMTPSFPSPPWEKLAMDLCELRGKIHLLVIDYYSRWIESKCLGDRTSEGIAYVLRYICFSRDTRRCHLR